MKQHTAICDKVTLENADSIWLHALRDVFDGISICGNVTCEDRITILIQFIFGRGIVIVMTSIAFIFILMLTLIPCYRIYTTNMLSQYNNMHFRNTYSSGQKTQSLYNHIDQPDVYIL